MLSGDDITRIQLAATLNIPLSDSGVEDNSETRAAYEKITEELDDAPAGVMVTPVFDAPDVDKWTDLIDKQEAKYGKPY